MLKTPLDLSMPALAADAAHQVAEPRRIRGPARRPTFGKAAEIDELHFEAADATCLREHVALELAGEVPGRLPAHGGVEREDQPLPLRMSAGLGQGLRLGQELGDGGARR